MFSFLFGALLVLFILLVWAFRILREYERGVVFNLGRYWAVKGPGWFILIPVIQQMVKMDLRTVVLDVPPQDVITRDNVSVKVNAVVYFRVIDPQKAVIQVADFLTATNLLAQTTLRAVLGKHELDALLAEREQLNLDIQKRSEEHTSELQSLTNLVCRLLLEKKKHRTSIRPDQSKARKKTEDRHINERPRSNT